ncbi:endonuclease [Flavobacterium sp. '19STA2R22 D10 B1']|uniref:endonuclease n=1 Tax=Flavobacterium aerium TaxID=3037261 RepID=UPI00278BCC77|nr:endonuclease [Flavobacterium sp. '19STA2R22 D10 B1']
MKTKVLTLLLMPFYCLAQIPSYYSSVDFSQTGDALKVQLTQLITATHTNVLPYTSNSTTDVWTALKQTDLDPNDPTKVLLIYGFDDTDAITSNDRTRSKDLSCHTSSCNGLWVREHTYARSLGTPNLEFINAGSDAHHLRSIDSQMNNTRSNRPFTAGSGNAHTVGTQYFYPGDEWKGDVARMMMYMYVRYPTQCLPSAIGSGSTSYSNFGDMYNIFLEWNAEDPVSAYEMNRNNILQTLQGNRNPFIDNPHLATIIWNGPVTTDSWNVLNVTENSLNAIVLYPTITTDYVHINNPAHETFSYVIYNMMGQEIKSGTTEDVIDVTNNTKGLYLINLRNQNQQKTFKVILK